MSKEKKPKKSYTGVNIQYPISRLILSGEKTIETRTYPLPKKYENTALLLVETPGKEGAFKARVIATVTFGASFLYETKKDFYMEENKHRVARNSRWAWKDKAKWGWPIISIKKIKPRPTLGRRGIIFTKRIQLA